MTVRGIRGAISISNNSVDDIINGTKELLSEMLLKNKLEHADIISIFFSTTSDLNATFPAKAARELDLIDTPLLCLNEIDVPNSLQKIIRILMHVNSTKKQSDIQHIYLKDAVKLRPDLAKNNYNL